MSDSPTSTSVVRLVGSWLVVGVPLVYGIVEAIRSTVPLFS